MKSSPTPLRRHDDDSHVGSVTGNTDSCDRCQIFVDETKQRNYLLVAGVVLPGDLRRTRAVIRGLVLGGQRRVHMAKESDPRPRLIAAAICETGVRTTIYNAGRGNRGELDARGPSCTRWSATRRPSAPRSLC